MDRAIGRLCVTRKILAHERSLSTVYQFMTDSHVCSCRAHYWGYKVGCACMLDLVE